MPLWLAWSVVCAAYLWALTLLPGASVTSPTWIGTAAVMGAAAVLLWWLKRD